MMNLVECLVVILGHFVLGFESQGLPEPVLDDISFKARLEQCHKFLSEELEPDHLLQNEKLDSLFEPVREAVRKMTNRRAKIEVILKYLEEQSEENIKLVLKTYREDSVIHKYLFPNTEEFLYSGEYTYRANTCSKNIDCIF